VTVSGAPDLSDVKAWLGLSAEDVYDDAVLTESLNAALAAQARVVAYPRDDVGAEVFTDDLAEAIYLRTQRLAARRNSPEGVVGLSGIGGDFVSARIPAGDADVLRLEGPYLRIPVA
jgi:hypothetical protein